MAADVIPQLPEGFKIDETPPLPQGFQLDQPQKPAYSMFDAMGNVAGELSKSAYKIGGHVTDWATRLGLSPEAAARLGFVANVGTEAIPTILGAGLTAKAAPAVEATAKGLMQSAIKPITQDLLAGKADRAVNTMLEKGINVSRGGMAQLRAEGTALNDQVSNLLSQSGAKIDKNVVASKIQDVVGKIERFESTPQDSIAAVERVYDQFLTNGLVPKNIPVTQAQELKQGIYAMLKKKYGQLGSETEEAQKAIARGYKEELEKAVPQITSLNADASQVWNALNVAERRALLEMNKNPGGIGLLIHDPKVFAVYMADKSSLFKSIIANALYKHQRAITATPGAVAGTIMNQQAP